MTAAGKARDECVDEHIGRAGVEGEHLRRLRGGGDDGNVGDATKIEGGAAELWMAIEKIVGVGDERRALAAESDIGGAKITDRGDARASRDDGRFADLQCRGGRPAEVWGGSSLMINSLAVAADQRNVLR